jgi:hypothetical protein
MGKAVSKVLGGAAKAVTNVVKAVVQPVYNATLKQIPGVDNALVGLDKAVGKTIPGGWGTVASIASTFIPGSQFGVNGLLNGITRTQLATGLGALAGSGVMRKGHEFNLQGAIMGGAMAYGGAKLSEGLQAAGQATPGGANAAAEKALTEGAKSSVTPTVNAFSKLPEIPLDAAGNVAEGAANVPSFSEYYKPPVPPVSAPVPGQFVPPSVGEFGGGLKDVATGSGYMGADGLGALKSSTPGLLGGPPPPGMLDKLAQTGSETLSNMGRAGRGIANMTGFGAESGTAAAARNAFTNQFGLGAGTALVMGSSGLMALEEQKKMLKEELATGTIAQDEYNQALQAIEDQEKIARETVAANPLRTDSGIAGSLSGSGNDSPASYETLYDATPSSAGTLYANTPSRSRVYAKGGEVEDYGLSNLRKYALGGIVADDYSGYGPLDQGFNFNYPQQNQVNSNYPSPSNFDRPQSGPTTPSSYYQNTGLDSFGGYGSGMGYAAGGEVQHYWGGGVMRRAIEDMENQREAEAAVNVGREAEAAINVGREAVKNNPFKTESGPEISIGIQGLNRGSPTDLLYPQKKSRMKYDLPEYATGGYAMGGEPRFLSGGGDGMSDSIKANINGTQEARLADGEFVIPADVVSHLGNGSSKAGAKQLYSMMDRIRSARTGRKSQGKQINPRKYMTA